jgi:hypothetical protein
MHKTFRCATHCQDCFRAGFTRPSLQHATIDLAQPPWIGKYYSASTPRVVFVSFNPAAGEHDHKAPNLERKNLILDYRDHQGDIEAYYAHQEEEIKTWGNLTDYYLDELDLVLQDTVMLNAAWCAALVPRPDPKKPGEIKMKNAHPARMLRHCFAEHTDKVLRDLQPPPQFVLLGGGRVKRFREKVEAACPKATIKEIWHFARMHKDAAAWREHLAPVKKAIREARAKAALRGA